MTVKKRDDNWVELDDRKKGGMTGGIVGMAEEIENFNAN